MHINVLQPQQKRASPLAEGDISFPLIAAGRRGLFVIFRRGRRGRSRTDPKAPRCLISSLPPPPTHTSTLQARQGTRDPTRPPPTIQKFLLMSASAAHDVTTMEPRAWFLPAGAGNLWAGRWRPRTKTGKRKRKRNWRSSRRFSRWNLQASARSKKAGTDRVRQCIHQGDSCRSPVTPAIMRMHPSALALGDSFGLLVSGLWRHSPCMVQQDVFSQHHDYVETKDSTVHPCLGSWPSVLKKALYITIYKTLS